MEFQSWSNKSQIGTFLAVLSVIAIVLKLIPALLPALRRIPGPWYARWTNLPLKWSVIQGRRLMYIDSLHEEYGSFVRISPSEIAVSNLDAHKAIHRVGSGFNKSDWYQKLSDGPPVIFTIADPKQHATRRKLFAQAFSNSSIQIYVPLVKDRVALAVEKIKRDAQAGNADILKWFTFMATDVSGEVSFGKSFDMLQQEEKSAYIKDIDMACMVSGIKAELGPIVAFLKLLPIPSLQHAFSFEQRLSLYGHQAIQDLRNHIVMNAPASKSIFTNMIDQEKNAGLTDEELAQEALNLIIAGSETTGISLTYTIWALLRPINRTFKETLLEELSAAGPVDKLSMKELAALPYLNAVIKEGLRLYCAAPGSLPRVVPVGGTVLGGYAIPAGMTVSTQAYTDHRNSQTYGDANRFIPDRWLDPTADMNAAFSAFGTGSRGCLGIHLAMVELQIGLCTFFQECAQATISPTTTDATMEFVNYFSITPKGGKCEISMVS